MPGKSEKLGEAHVELRADASRLQSGLNEAKQSTERWVKTTESGAAKADSAFKNVGKTLSGFQSAISKIFIPLAVFNQVASLIDRFEQLRNRANSVREAFSDIGKAGLGADLYSRLDDAGRQMRELTLNFREQQQEAAKLAKAQQENLGIFEKLLAAAQEKTGFRSIYDTIAEEQEAAARRLQENLRNEIAIIQARQMQAISDGNKQLLRQLALSGLTEVQRAAQETANAVQDVYEQIFKTDNENAKRALLERAELIQRLGDERIKRARDAEEEAARKDKERHDEELRRIEERAEAKRKAEIDALRAIRREQEASASSLISSLSVSVGQFARVLDVIQRNNKQVMP